MEYTSTWATTLTSENVSLWASGNQKLAAANPMHPEQLQRVVLTRVRLFDPVFIDGTVTSDVYLSLLSERICPFPDGIRHSEQFDLVPTRQCQTSHQEFRTSLSLWRIRGVSSVEPVTCTVWERVFEEQVVSEKSTHNSGTKNCHPIRDWSHFYKTSLRFWRIVFFVCMKFVIFRDIKWETF
jgi:hypothetical protein